MTHIIFLDIDGVLCTHRCAAALGEKGLMANLDPIALAFLNRLCQEYDIRVVISSTWRKGKDRRHFYELFMASGNLHLARALDYNWCTINTGGCRGDEIQEWLDRCKWDGYTIIDDDSDMLEHQKDHFIKTNNRNGMLFEHYIAIEEKIKQHFEKENVNIPSND
jgi:hypothetical protein